MSNVNSLLCIGLDPHIVQLPSPTADAAYTFCKEIIDETHMYAASFKPNSAFFEALGPEGIAALIALIQYIKSIDTIHPIPIVFDCKRGDIGSTAEAYATYAYDIITPDCPSSVTLSPYMGYDSIKPFLTGKYKDRGVFMLCKTSNLSSKDLQDTILDNHHHHYHQDGSSLTVYERVLTLCTSTWMTQSAENDLTDETTSGIKDKIGIVAGATDIPALTNIRQRAPQIWILCPGVGSQGGDAPTVCSVALRQDGSGVLINVSRGISAAHDKNQAARVLCEQINQQRQIVITAGQASVNPDVTPSSSSSNGDGEKQVALLEHQRQFLALASEKQALKFGSFTLKSGRVSPYFFNAGLFSCGKSMSTLSKCYAQSIYQACQQQDIQFDVIFGPAYKGIPLACSVASAWYDLYGESKNYAYNRKEPKDHGEGGTLVGANMTGQRILIVDDVITAGTAIRESVALLKNIESATLVGIAVSVDRQEKPTDQSIRSAIQQVNIDLGVPVIAIVELRHIITFLQHQLDVARQRCDHNGASIAETTERDMANMMQYRERYGVEY